MNETTITVQGFAGGTPELRTIGEHHVANFRLACTPRRFNRKTQAWSDTPTNWYTVSAWRGLGRNAAASIRSGDPVVVTGRLVLREWTSAAGERVVSQEIEATSIGHDLSRTQTSVVRQPRDVVALPQRAAEASVAPDPVDEDEANRQGAALDWGAAGESDGGSAAA